MIPDNVCYSLDRTSRKYSGLFVRVCLSMCVNNSFYSGQKLNTIEPYIHSLILSIEKSEFFSILES